MNDPLAALRPWVGAGHLPPSGPSSDDDRAASCREIGRFLTGRVADELARFLTTVAVRRPSYRLFSHPGPVEPERWETAPDADRLAKGSTVAGPGDGALSDGAVRYVRFLHAMRSAAFRELVEKIGRVGLRPVHELTSWCMTAGDLVRPHRFDPATCAMRATVCLSTTWRSRFGGAWCALDEQERLTRIPFRHNTLLLMDASAGATFWVAPIRADADGAARISVTACFARAS